MPDIYPAPSQPYHVAQEILEEKYTATDKFSEPYTLGYYRDDWVFFTGAHWLTGPSAAGVEKQLKGQLFRLLGDAHYLVEDNADDTSEISTRPWNPTPARVNNVAETMMLEVNDYLDDRRDAPFWVLPRETDHSAAELVSLRNGLLHLPTRTLVKHTARLFNTWSLPFDYEADAECPSWMAFLDDVFEHDPDGALLLQEFAGYAVSGRSDMHKALLIIGPPRAGKGTFCRILTRLLGTDNVATPTLRTLGSEYGLATLIGKPLAVIGDARADDSRSANAITEAILNITGGDSVTANRKYLHPWTGTLPSRLVMASNEVPRFLDASGAVATRFVSVRLVKTFLGKEDHGLEDRLVRELPGIYNWALSGLDRLTEQGAFTVPETMEATREQLTAHASPVTEFLEDTCIVTGDTEDYLNRKDLYDKFRWWAQDNGFQPPNLNTFVNRLTAADPRIRPMNKRLEGKARMRAVVGVKYR